MTNWLDVEEVKPELPCYCCNGRGEHYEDGPDCSECEGTGRNPIVAREVLKAIAALPEPPDYDDPVEAEIHDPTCHCLPRSRELRRIWLVAKEIVGE